tara:strand:- start:499 stop:774 length:276 start_codon:yes stop_codon:yes gene_type:complete
VADFVDQKVVTIEGLAEDAVGRSVQQAFIEKGAAQCGYCTPGIVIATTALLNQINRPTAADIHGALDRHLCRCGSHPHILAAIQQVIDRDT